MNRRKKHRVMRKIGPFRNCSGFLEFKPSQTQIGQARVIVGTPTKRPVKFALFFGYGHLVDGGMPEGHVAVFIKLPVLVAIGTEIGRAHV